MNNWRIRSISGCVLLFALNLLPVLDGVAGQTTLALKRVNGYPNLTITGNVSSNYLVQVTPSLSPGFSWQFLTNLTATSSSLVFVDQTAPVGGRFYRVLAGVNSTNPNPSLFLAVPAGTFVMGSPYSETGRSSLEGPQTTVTLSAFFMSKYPVRQSEYLAVMGVNPSASRSSTDLPVEQVSWDDATNYCARLTQRDRQAGILDSNWAYRLPTEAEWEYTCRAGTTTRYSFGDDLSYTLIDGYAWYLNNSGNTTHIVGTKGANPWGFYDMQGNVSQWCADGFSFYSGGSAVNPQAPDSSLRIVRGGNCGYGSSAVDCRSAARTIGNQGTGYPNIGFRVVLAQIQ